MGDEAAGIHGRFQRRGAGIALGDTQSNQVRRREFIAGSAAFLGCSPSSATLAATSWRIGQVFPGSPDSAGPSELMRALVSLGHVDGKDVQLRTIFAEPNLAAMKAAIASIVPDVDLLVVWGPSGVWQRNRQPGIFRSFLYLLGHRWTLAWSRVCLTLAGI
jgi:hypothetical protein